MGKKISLLGLCIILVAVSFPAALAATAAADVYSIQQDSSNNERAARANRDVGQTFKAVDAQFERISVLARKNNPPSGLQLQVGLYAADAGGLPTGSALSAGTLDTNALSEQFAWTPIDFTPVVLTAGETYVIVFQWPDNSGGYVLFGMSTLNPYAEGNMVENNSDSGWSVIDSSWDMAFRVHKYGVPDEPDEPALRAGHSIGQTFIAETTDLNQVAFKLAKLRAADSVTVDVYLHEVGQDGFPAGPALSEAALNMEDVGDEPGWVTLDFSAASLTVGGTYGFIFRWPDGIEGYLLLSTQGTRKGGQMIANDDNQGWQTMNEAWNLDFRMLTGALPTCTAPNAEFQVALEVTERNGAAAYNQLIRRGIPFAAGELCDVEKIKLADEIGGQIAIQTKVMERYAEDGSVKWLSLAFLADLQANQQRTFYLRDHTAASSYPSDLTVTQDGNAVTVENANLKLVVEDDRIGELTFDDVPVIPAAGIRPYIEAGREGGIAQLQSSNERMLRGNRQIGQTFTALEDTLEKVSFLMYKEEATPDLTIPLKLFQVDSAGVPVGAALAQTVLETDDLTDTMAWHTLTFASTSLTVGQQYGLFFTYPSSSGGAVFFALNVTGGYDGGNWMENNSNGGWLAPDSRWDITFRIHSVSQQYNVPIFLTDSTVDIVESGPVYTTVRVKGSFGEVPIEADWRITVAAGSAAIDHEYRITAKSSRLLDTTALRFPLDAQFGTIAHDGQTLTYADGLQLSDSDFVQAYNAADDITLTLLTRDNARFKGAVPGDESLNQGFSFDAPANGPIVVNAAPIQHRAAWKWYDGVSRTSHTQLTLNAGQVTSAGTEAAAANLFQPPAAIVDPQQFVAAGVLVSDVVPESSQRAVQWIKTLEDGPLWGTFEAGAIPWSFTTEGGQVTLWETGRRPGETEYNLWHAQMAIGDPDLYRLIDDSAESWADVQVYRGGFADIFGANRYRTGNMYGAAQQFFMSQPYYGDPDGLYLSYLMTGNPYYEETFRQLIDYTEKVVDTNNTPLVVLWTDEDYGDPNWSIGSESRYSLQARAFHNAYNLYHDAKYLAAADKIIDWMDRTITAEGAWYQFYDQYAQPKEMSGKLLIKNYIMLYGSRGLLPWIADDSPLVMRQRAQAVLVKFSDYLLSEIQDDGWLWAPVSDPAIKDEYGGRADIPVQETISLEILLEAFKLTGNEAYLDGLARIFRYVLAIQLDEGGFREAYGAEGYVDWLSTPIIGPSTAQYLRISPAIYELFQEHEEQLRELGHGDIVDVFQPATTLDVSTPVHGFDPEEFSAKTFATDAGRAVYLVNHSGAKTGQWSKSVDVQVDDRPVVYAGHQVRISDQGTRVSADLAQYQALFLREIPIRLQVPQGLEVMTNTETYDSERIELHLASAGTGTVVAAVYDGEFGIADNILYSVSINGQLQTMYPADGQLTFALPSGEQEWQVVIVQEPTKSAGAPGKPVLSHDNGHDTGLFDGSYAVAMNMWWGNNGRQFRLYENDVLIDQQALADASPTGQATVTSVTDKPNGVYRYVAELSNAFGTTRSEELVVTVTHAKPALPVLSHDNWMHGGDYTVTMNQWWGTNGTTYRLYENGVLIDTQSLQDDTPNAQTAVTGIGSRAPGTYVYRAELINYAGTTPSGEIVVHVYDKQ